MSLFEYNVNLSKDYTTVYTDASKLAVVMLSYHILRNIVNGKSQILPDAAVQAILYAILGIFIYHLIFVRVLRVNFTADSITEIPQK